MMRLQRRKVCTSSIFISCRTDAAKILLGSSCLQEREFDCRASAIIKGNMLNSTTQSKKTTTTTLAILKQYHIIFEMECRDAPKNRDEFTYFHSTAIPEVDLFHIGHFLMSALHDRFGVNADIVGAAIVLARRFSQTQPVTTDMMHRIYVTALWISIKINCDTVPRSCDYARLSGLRAWELTRLELAFLHGIDHRALVFQEEVDELVLQCTIFA